VIELREMQGRCIDESPIPLEAGLIDFNDKFRLPKPRNYMLICVATAIQLSAMTIVFTSSEAYSKKLGLDGGFWPGFLIGIVPILAGMSGFGWQYLNNRVGYKSTYVVTAFVALVGAVFYALAGYAQSPAILVLGRVLLGIGTPRNVMFHYLAVTVGKAHKTARMGQVLACASFGLGLGPLLSSFFDYVFGDVAGLNPSAPIIFNTLSLPGWVLAALFMLLIVGFLFLFEDVPLSEQHRYTAFTAKVNTANTANSPSQLEGVWLYIALIMLLITVITNAIGIGSMETRTAFIAIGNSTYAKEVGSGFAWSWSPVVAGVYVGGIFIWFTFFGFWESRLAGDVFHFEDRSVLLLAFAIGSVSSALLFNYDVSKDANIVMWTIGLLMFQGALIVGKVHVFSLALKLAPNKWIDSYTVWISLMNCFGRGIGPMIATYVGDGYLESTIFTSIILAFVVANTLGISLLYTKLKVSS